MEIKGLNLDDSPAIAEDKSLAHARNIRVENQQQAYMNEESLKYISDMYPYICGLIPTNIGFVIFIPGSDVIDGGAIIYYEYKNETIEIKKYIYGEFNFHEDRPITGDYSYNQYKQLIVTFTEGVSKDANETRVININNPNYKDTTISDDNPWGEREVWLSNNDLSLLNLIPDVIYPTLNFSVEDTGNLKTGAYQIAFRYKLNDDTYSNWSILHPSIIITGDYEDDFPVGSFINKSIKISFSDPDMKFKEYEYAIVYMDGEGQLCYHTESITLSAGTNSYRISSFDSMVSTELEEIVVKNITYVKDATHTNFNNRLLRGNVETVDYSGFDDILSNIAAKARVGIDWTPKEEIINTDKKYHKEGEVYSLYMGFFDYKGNFVNAYKVPWKSGDATTSWKSESIDGNLGYDHLIPASGNNTGKGFGEKKIYSRIVESDIMGDIIAIEYSTNYSEIETESFYVRNTLDRVYGSGGFTSYRSLQFKEKPRHPLIVDSATGNKYFSIRFRVKYTYDRLVNRDIRLRANIFKKDGNGEYRNVISEVFSSYGNMRNEDTFDRYFTINLGFPASNNIEDLRFGIYVINTLTTPGEEVIYPIVTEFYADDIIVDVPNNAFANINVTPTDLSNLPKSITNFCIFEVEHNPANSRIIAQAVALKDVINNKFGTSIEYSGQFESNVKTRIYPFEYLYNKSQNIIVNKIVNKCVINDVYIVDVNPKLPDSSKTYDDSAERQVTKNGVTVTDLNVIDCKYLEQDPGKDLNATFAYIATHNSQVDNITGESYYRDTWDEGEENNSSKPNRIVGVSRYGLIDLINDSHNYYTDIYNQKLEIISSIYPLTTTAVAKCNGDFFYSYLTLRACAPGKIFDTTDNDRKKLNKVWRWVFTIPVESRFNIKGRYSQNAIERSYKLHNADITSNPITASALLSLINQEYTTDNFIYTETGRGYDPIYNENGIENYVYFKTIENAFKHITRLVRSDVFTSESLAVAYRYFKASDYKDMPTNRGPIVSLKTDNKNVYIQQEYGLRLASVQDTLSTNDSGSSYLGSSDLFDREPVELMYSPSGYIGCESIFDTYIGILGYYVCDAEKGKIFHVKEKEISEISANKAKQWFKRNILSGENNPFIQKGRYFVFNEDTNVLHFIQNHTDNPFNITNYVVTNNWLSFHDYIPLFGFTIRSGSLWIDNNNYDPKLYETDKHNYGKFFNDIIYPAIIKILLNPNPLINKELVTIGWKDRVSYRKNKEVEVVDWYKTIDKIAVHNNDQCTGYKTVKFNNTWYEGKTGVNKVNVWFFNNIKDLAKDEDFLINQINIDSDKIKKDSKWYNINRFYSQFVYAILNFNNEELIKKWELQEISSEYDIDNRNNTNQEK